MAQRKTGDLNELQGTWAIVTLEMDGATMPSGGSKIVVKGKRFTTISMGATYSGTISVDSTQSPKAFDLKFEAGPEKGNTSLGIYELDGDNWKLCLTVTGSTRPLAFATKPGSGFALETLRRETVDAAAPESKAPTPAPNFEPVAELQGEWQLVSLVTNGAPVDPRGIPYGKRVVKGDEMTLKFGPQLITRAKIQADTSAQPKIMDYVHLAGAMAGQAQQGIYELERQTLRICSAPPGEARPADFSANPENRRTLAVWTLAKK